MNKSIETAAKILAGVGAINVGTSKLINFDILSFVPTGIVSTIAVAVVAASGALVLYLLYERKI